MEQRQRDVKLIMFLPMKVAMTHALLPPYRSETLKKPNRVGRKNGRVTKLGEERREDSLEGISLSFEINYKGRSADSSPLYDINSVR